MISCRKHSQKPGHTAQCSRKARTWELGSSQSCAIPTLGNCDPGVAKYPTATATIRPSSPAHRRNFTTSSFKALPTLLKGWPPASEKHSSWLEFPGCLTTRRLGSAVVLSARSRAASSAQGQSCSTSSVAGNTRKRWPRPPRSGDCHWLQFFGPRSLLQFEPGRQAHATT